MQDDLRADLLHRALIEHQPLPDDLDDAELAELGADLERLGPEIALLAQAEEAFDPAFAKRLKGTLLAAHPTASPAGAGVASGPAGMGLAAPGARPRALVRRLLAVIVLVIALLAALVVGLLHNPQRTPLLSTAQVTSTAARPLITAASRAVGTQAATPDIRSTQRSTGATVRPPVAPEPAATTLDVHAFAQGAAPHGAVTKAPALQYRLPATLPALPATVPIYTLHEQALSDAVVREILAHFPGMKKNALSTADLLVLKNGNEELRIIRSTGEVRYSAGRTYGGRAAQCCPAPEAAIVSAYTWLVAHRLYPAGVDQGSPTVTTLAHGTTRVRFAPATRLPLTDNQDALVLTVDLGSADHVIAAHRLWPALEETGTATLLAPAKALDATGSSASQGANGGPRANTPTSQTFQIEQITAVYQVSASGGRRSLEPGYLLSGRLVTSAGASHPFTQVISATGTATGTAP